MNGSNAVTEPLPASGPTARRPYASPELRRVLADIRVIIAIVATIEAAALSLHSHPTLVFAVLCYTVYAGWLGWLATRGDQAASPLTSWIDALWILFIAWLAATPSNLFILLLLFPVLFASLSYGLMSGLLVSLFAAIGALLITRSTHGGVIPPETVLFPLSLVVLGPLVAGLARAGVQLNEQVSIADELMEKADPRQGVERVAGEVLQTLLRHAEADLGLLLVWLPGSEPRLFRCDRSAQIAEVRGELLAPLLAAFGRLPRDVASVDRLTALPGHRSIHRHSGFHVVSEAPSKESRPAMEALSDLLDARSFLTVPLCRRAPRACWLLLDSARRRYRTRDAAMLSHVMERLSPVIENAGLLEQLAEEAAATERARIGRDLHDTAIQPYLGIKYAIEALARKARPDNPLHADIAALREMATEELHQLRETVSNMRAGNACGEDTLAPALRRQARRFSELFGLEVNVDCEGKVPINRKLSAAFFHLVSEALTNIRRHTRATRADIRVFLRDADVVLQISNDHGAEPAPATPFVPRSIAERAESINGCAVVDLQRPGFTDLIITVPKPNGG